MQKEIVKGCMFETFEVKGSGQIAFSGVEWGRDKRDAGLGFSHSDVFGVFNGFGGAISVAEAERLANYILQKIGEHKEDVAKGLWDDDYEYENSDTQETI